MDYKYAAGLAGSRFLTELRDNRKIMGIRCPKCRRVYVPPRLTCKECFSNLDEWLELSGKGTLNSYTVVYYSETFHPVEPPIFYGIIQLDGADTGLPHLLGEVELNNVRIGMRVEPVFKEKREGNILDIKYFKPL
ncbi:Zn-ribbon domain-containing OB-fold protein, partial [Chloroflexota bacterium]